MAGWTEADPPQPEASPRRRRPVWRGIAAFLFGLAIGVGTIVIVAETLVPPTIATTSFIDQASPPPLRR